MKKNILKLLLVIFLCVSALLIYNRITIADVGNFESYDSDWGSSSSSWDSGSSWSSYDSGSSWSRSNSSSYSGSLGFPGGLKGLIILVICTIILVPLLVILEEKREQKKLLKKQNKNRENMNTVNDESKGIEKITNVIMKSDELFNKDEFIKWASDLFIKLQMAWSERDWESIRVFETPELFEQHRTQLQGYIDIKQINVLKDVQVLRGNLIKFEQVGDKDILTIVLATQMIDYIVEEESRKVIRGSNSKLNRGIYELTFIRRTGVKSKPGMNTINTTNCPNCGAEMKISATGKCEHCGSVITTGEFNWVLSNLERIM